MGESVPTTEPVPCAGCCDDLPDTILVSLIPCPAFGEGQYIGTLSKSSVCGYHGYISYLEDTCEITLVFCYDDENVVIAALNPCEYREFCEGSFGNNDQACRLPVLLLSTDGASMLVA
jgi:hypothetical protein